MPDDLNPSPPSNADTSQPGTVLVFGATGQQGGAVARALRARGRPVRALVRDPGRLKAAALADMGVELVRGDLSDVSSIREAMSGAHGVFSVQPSSGQGPVYGMTDADEYRYGTAIADLSVELGVNHLVYSSVATAGKGETGLGHFDIKTEIEDHIRSLDLVSTIIRPSTFMELLMLPGMGLDKGVLTFLMRPGQLIQLIAVEDIGRIVASILDDPGRWAGRTLDIAGDALTGERLQEALSRAAGQPIRYARFPDALLEENAFLARLAALLDDGRLAGGADIDALRRAFGGLLTFEAWLAGTGAPLLKAALETTEAPVALR